MEGLHKHWIQHVSSIKLVVLKGIAPNPLHTYDKVHISIQRYTMTYIPLCWHKIHINFKSLIPGSNNFADCVLHFSNVRRPLFIQIVLTESHIWKAWICTRVPSTNTTVSNAILYAYSSRYHGYLKFVKVYNWKYYSAMPVWTTYLDTY
jgi:hypothetical protein